MLYNKNGNQLKPSAPFAEPVGIQFMFGTSVGGGGSALMFREMNIKPRSISRVILQTGNTYLGLSAGRFRDVLLGVLVKVVISSFLQER